MWFFRAVRTRIKLPFLHALGLNKGCSRPKWNSFLISLWLLVETSALLLTCRLYIIYSISILDNYSNCYLHVFDEGFNLWMLRFLKIKSIIFDVHEVNVVINASTCQPNILHLHINSKCNIIIHQTCLNIIQYFSQLTWSKFNNDIYMYSRPPFLNKCTMLITRIVINSHIVTALFPMCFQCVSPVLCKHDTSCRTLSLTTNSLSLFLLPQFSGLRAPTFFGEGLGFDLPTMLF